MKRKEKDMVNKYSIKQKILACILSVLVLFTALPVGMVATGISNGIRILASEAEGEKPPTSLDDVTIPTVTKNPYDVDVFVE